MLWTFSPLPARARRRAATRDPFSLSPFDEKTHGDARRRWRARSGVIRVFLEPSRADELRDELDGIVRTMFVLYSLLIVGGVVFFITVGLTQQ